MLKLYKRGRVGIRYWEAWKVPGMVVVHEGKIGERGKTRWLLPEPGQRQAVERFVRVAARTEAVWGIRTPHGFATLLAGRSDNGACRSPKRTQDDWVANTGFRCARDADPE